MKNVKIVGIDLELNTVNLVKELCSLKGFEYSPTIESEASAGTHLIILDVERSGRTLLDWVTRIKASAPDTPILLLTKAELLPVTHHAIRQGAFNYLFKPFELADLAALVEVAVDYARLRGSSRVQGVQNLFEDYPTLEELEKRYMKAVLEKTRGRKEKAAKILGINRRTLYRKEREYGWVSQEEEVFENS